MAPPPDDATPVPAGHHQRVKELFMAALDVPRGRRAAYLAGACGGDEALRREVLELFLLHGESDPMLDAPLDGSQALSSLATPAAGFVGPYRLVRELGRGGMGVVHLAELGGRCFAVKLLTSGSLSPEVRERFRLEAEILGRLDHPGIARVHDAGEFVGPGGVTQPWIAMQYVEGRPLHEYVRDEAPGLEDRIRLLARVCDAVQHAHAHGIVHRDLKPSNIVVRADGSPVVLDFGVARLVSGDERPTELVTRTGQLVGTPQYMSPEQVQAEPASIGPPSDVYSLGIIAYELLAGRLPYQASSVSLHRAIVSILTFEPPPLGQVAPSLRGPLERIVAMALEKDPALRYPDAGALGDDLRRRLEGRTVRARGPGLTRRVLRWSRRRRRLAAALAVVALAAVVLAAWRLGTDRAFPRERVLANYREAETILVQAGTLLYEGERTPARMRECIDRYTRARTLIEQVPPLRHRELLLRQIDKDLGTAQFLLGEYTWDPGPYRASVMTFQDAMDLSSRQAPGWDREIQVPAARALGVPQTDLLGLLAAAQLGLHRLWGQAPTLQWAADELHEAMRMDVERLGPPRPPRGHRGIEAPGDPFAYHYNSLAEVTTDLARFRASAELARAATLYSDSAIARRNSFRTHWPAIGSLLFERGRAWHALGALAGVRADLDTATRYLRACADYRGVNRPWVFAQTREELASLALDRARLTPAGPARSAVLRAAMANVDTALRVLAPAGYAPAASASLRSLQAEILTELGREERQVALLDSASALLERASDLLPATSLPRHAALVWLRLAIQDEARFELTSDGRLLEAADEALDRSAALSEPREDSLVIHRVLRERPVLERLRAQLRPR